jgi:hypothetical protein
MCRGCPYIPSPKSSDEEVYLLKKIRVKLYLPIECRKQHYTNNTNWPIEYFVTSNKPYREDIANGTEKLHVTHIIPHNRKEH